MFFFSSRRRHTICALVTGVQTCALPIYHAPAATIAVGAPVEVLRLEGEAAIEAGNDIQHLEARGDDLGADTVAWDSGDPMLAHAVSFLSRLRARSGCLGSCLRGRPFRRCRAYVSLGLPAPDPSPPAPRRPTRRQGNNQGRGLAKQTASGKTGRGR